MSSEDRKAMNGGNTWAARCFEAIPIDSLVAFRLFFGAMMLIEVLSFLFHGWVNTTFIEPRFLFKYHFFEWVHPWPGNGMLIHFQVLAALACCIICGLFYRLATVLFASGIIYVFLLEKAIYLNHMYLICLLSVVLAIVPVNRAFSLDVLIWPRMRSTTIPQWALWLVRLQVGIPYFFGGIAKLNRDWLTGNALMIHFTGDGTPELITRYLANDGMVMFLTIGGLIFDLTIVPLLLWRRTRFAAFCCAVMFHLANSTLFNIGIFPWLMIGATTVFLPPDWPRRFLQVPVSHSIDAQPGRLSRRQWLTLSFLMLYASVQIVLPLRQFLYARDPNWTDEGHTFCWRMMLRSKQSKVEVVIVDSRSRRRKRVDPRLFLTPRQIRNLSRSPDLMLQFSHFLAREHRRLGGGALEVYWRVQTSLNGCQPQLLIDPDVDLAAQKRNVWPASWILPLRERESAQVSKAAEL